jgi:TolB-like protein/Tfp pilus assembly protein PilF/Tfp pilus assembly protein PilO
VNPKTFFAELKRRNVYKVAIAYAVVAWLLMQVASQIFPFFEIPNWAVRLVVLLLIIGFPVALILAWAFELTPEGIKLTESADREAAKPSRNKAWIYVVMITATLSFALFFVGRYTAPKVTRSSESLAKSIAVLPFENLSRDPDNAYFAEGIKEEVLARLSKVADLKVISIRSTQRSKNSLTDLSQMAQKLGVETFLEGSVQRSADEVRVTVQLVRAESNAHLWADTFDRKLTDIFAVESEIAKAVADTLQAKLTGSEERAISAKPTWNLEAYQLYLRGRYYWNRRTAGGLKKALEQFQQAVDKDPTYALAYTGLADCYAVMEQYAGSPSSETLPRAKAAALHALHIDDSLGEAHTSLGYVNTLSWQFGGAEKEFKRGIQLNPNYPTAHHWYGLPYLSMLGRLDEAMAEIKRAQQLDPLSPIISANAGNLYVLKRDLNPAIEEFKKVIELDPNFPIARDFLGCAYLKQGHEQEAITELQKGVELSGRASQELGFLGYGYGALGKRAEARALLKELEERYARKESPAMHLAAVYAGLGEKDQAFAWLERDFQGRTGLLIFITTLPDYDTLRDDPRYTDLLRRIGLRP